MSPTIRSFQLRVRGTVPILLFLHFSLSARSAWASERSHDHGEPPTAAVLAHANDRADHATVDHEDRVTTSDGEQAAHASGPASTASSGEGEVDPELDLDLDMYGSPPVADKVAYASFLRAALSKARPHVIAQLEQKMATSQATSMNRLSTGLFLFSLLGIFLVFRPLLLLRKYPGRGKSLFGYGAASAGLFFLTVNLFAIAIGLLEVAQGAAGHFTNPQVAVIEAAFDVLDRNAGELVDLAPNLIEPALHQLAKGDASFIVALLDNFKGIKNDIDAILAIAKAMKALDGVFAWIPALLTLIALLTFARSAKDTLMALVRLPEAAVEGGGAGIVIRGALRRVKNELYATLCLIGVLVLLALAGGLALRAAVEPAVEAFLSTVFLTAMYIQVERVSSAVLFGSLGLSALVLVLNVVVVLAGSSGALGKLHKIFQRKFHEGLALRAHRRFWTRAPLALATCFLFPLGYELLAEKAVEALLHRTIHAQEPRYALALVGSPALVVLGFFVCFAVVFGVHGLLFLFRYPVKTIALAPQPAGLSPLSPKYVRRPQAAPQSRAPSPPSSDLEIFDRLVLPNSQRFAVGATMAVTALPAALRAPLGSTKLSNFDRTILGMPPVPQSKRSNPTIFHPSGVSPLAPMSSTADDTIRMPSPFIVDRAQN